MKWIYLIFKGCLLRFFISNYVTINVDAPEHCNNDCIIYYVINLVHVDRSLSIVNCTSWVLLSKLIVKLWLFKSHHHQKKKTGTSAAFYGTMFWGQGFPDFCKNDWLVPRILFIKVLLKCCKKRRKAFASYLFHLEWFTCN